MSMVLVIMEWCTLIVKIQSFVDIVMLIRLVVLMIGKAHLVGVSS